MEVRTAGGLVVVAEVVHVTANQCQVLFSAPQTGTAHCSL